MAWQVFWQLGVTWHSGSDCLHKPEAGTSRSLSSNPANEDHSAFGVLRVPRRENVSPDVVCGMLPGSGSDPGRRHKKCPEAEHQKRPEQQSLQTAHLQFKEFLEVCIAHENHARPTALSTRSRKSWRHVWPENFELPLPRIFAHFSTCRRKARRPNLGSGTQSSTNEFRTSQAPTMNQSSNH